MNLGEVLASARATSRVTLEDLAGLTSIRPGLLSEMEQNNFRHCGGDIYARGHLRNIAPKIGLDATMLINLYNEEHSVESRSINEMLSEGNVSQLPREKKNISWKVPAAFSLTVILVLAIVQIVISNVASDNTDAPVVIESASPSPTPTVSAESTATSSPIGGGVEMTITAARGNSLIDIVVDGKSIDKGSIFQGETRSFSAATSISIYFSNPAGLDVTVNGEPLAPLGGQNEEVRRTFR